MKKHSIKSMYSDALYWATSSQSKDKGYHITRNLEAVLRKLIHYDRSDEKITYSNEIIAQHTFMGEETIRKGIPELTKLGYISTVNFRISDGGEIKTRRTIFIKWDFIESILNDTPILKPQRDEILQTKESVKEVISTAVAEKPISEPQHTIPSNQTDSKENPIPKIVITDEKLKWFNNASNYPDLTKQELEAFEQDELRRVFYSDEGIWHADKSSKENQFGIMFVNRGGSDCKLYNNNGIHDHISIDKKDFGYYLKLKGIKFDKFTLAQYRDIKEHGLVKAPMDLKEVCYII